MTEKRVIFILLISALFGMSVVPVHAQVKEAVGTVSLGATLRLDYYSHKLADGWNASRSGYRDINYEHSYRGGVISTSTWESVYGQTLFLDLGLRPTRHLKGDFGFVIINDYADRYWMPVNLEHRMKLNNNNFLWTRGDIELTHDMWDVSYFRGAYKVSWDHEGDMFGLFPGQYEVERYLRVSGRPVPEGGQLNLKGAVNNLALIYGPEVVWGYKNGVYGNYNFSLLGLRSSVVFVDNVLPYGETDERMRSYSYSTALKAGGTIVRAGILYRPFRLDKEYEYVEKTAAGEGLLGSDYIRKAGTISQSDATGYGARVTFKPQPVFKEAEVQYMYRGIAAGNKEEYVFRGSRNLLRSLSGRAEFIYREPVIGNMPLVFEGTPLNPGPALFEPRGPESPFWVNFDNRQASIMSFTFTYDPTPVTWFYKYQPGIVDEWNLNKDENSKYSFALRYDMAKYYTETDRTYYYDQNGDIVWEPYGVTGAWATDDYIGAVTFVGKALLGKWRFILSCGTGDSLATTGLAYTRSEIKEKSATQYLDSGLSVTNGVFDLVLRYGKDIWGPEEWHRSFGETFDNLYRAEVATALGGGAKLGVSYTKAEELDYKYIAPELGSYEEIGCSLTWSFSAVGYFDSMPGKAIGIKP